MIAQIGVFALLPFCVLGVYRGFCTLSNNEKLNGDYMFSGMVRGFQAFESSAGYKLYGLEGGLIEGRESYDHPPHYWIISQSWDADFSTAEEVFWVEPGKITWSKGDEERSPQFSMCCALATGSNCTKHNMHAYASWEELRKVPTDTTCSINGTQDCPPAPEPENDPTLAIILGIFAIVVTAAVSAIVYYFWRRSQRSVVTGLGQQGQSGRICTAGCCDGFCSGPLYRIAPLVACIVVVLWSVVAMAGSEEAMDDVLVHLIELALVSFFTVDFIIQCCIIQGSQPDCCGDCGCGCGVTLLVKLIIDGIYLFIGWVGIAMAWIVSTDNVELIRLFRLLILAKMGMEIAAIVVLCMQSQVQVQQQIIGQPVEVPVAVGRAVIGQPVSMEPKTMWE
jgi:hypothetical protein